MLFRTVPVRHDTRPFRVLHRAQIDFCTDIKVIEFVSAIKGNMNLYPAIIHEGDLSPNYSGSDIDVICEGIHSACKGFGTDEKYAYLRIPASLRGTLTSFSHWTAIPM